MKTYCQKLITVAALGFAALTGLTACSSMTNSDPQKAEDSRLTSQVRSAFKNDPVFKYRDIQVAASYGKVQLSGFTSDAKEKQAAEQLARKVDGVKEVMNGITVH